MLIGWVQLWLVGFFIILYTVSPKTSAGTGFLPVPWALGAYLSFTVARIAFAYRRRLPAWFLTVSVVLDMALLMGLIFTFHLQYDQPAPFYLKAPTLLYVFIFIALRTLRFDPRYVVIAGLTAAAGWAFLLWYALDAMTVMNPITRDYVLYMTSNRVLIGAEIDKIISILVVTGVLAVALVRARRILVREVADSTVAADLSRFVSPELAAQVRSADRAMQPGDGEVKRASVLFSDIEGFSTISEGLTPDRLARMLNEYFAAMSVAIERHNGVITQFQGDAMLATFNAAKPDPMHAADAVRAAAEIRAIAESTLFLDGTQRLRTRCGVNTGDIVAGAVGTRDRLLFTVHGDEVNVAARLEQLNKQYGTYILATEQTVTEAGPEFAFEAVGEVTVRGRTTPTRVFTLR